MKSPSVWIIDIIQAADTIKRLLRNYPSKRFLEDERTILAIAKLIENIGEACSRLESEFKTKYPKIPWRKIVAMRNHLAHKYWHIDPEILWEAATKETQMLKNELTPFLKKIQAQETKHAQRQPRPRKLQ